MTCDSSEHRNRQPPFYSTACACMNASQYHDSDLNVVHHPDMNYATRRCTASGICACRHRRAGPPGHPARHPACWSRSAPTSLQVGWMRYLRLPEHELQYLQEVVAGSHALESDSRYSSSLSGLLWFLRLQYVCSTTLQMMFEVRVEHLFLCCCCSLRTETLHSCSTSEIAVGHCLCVALPFVHLDTLHAHGRACH